MSSPIGPLVQPFFHRDSSTWSYVVADAQSARAAVIDPVLDFDPKSARTSTLFADTLVDWVRERGFVVEWILETHAHADHLSAAQHLKRQLSGRIAIGAGICSVQEIFAPVFDLGEEFARDGSQFDHLFADGESFRVGGIDAQVIAVPGHTADSIAYRIGDALFVGDSLFMPDGGSARCDFPGGDAAMLYRSIQRLFALPDAMRVFVCHDYGPGGREVACETSIGEEKQNNIHLRGGVDEQAFVRMRHERDATLAVPALLLPAIQVNIRAGELPPAEANGVRYLKLPLDRI
jgi:glyoxylase-like metal-dependent hydrolase (beta-lactamase superfamily II)